MASKRRIRRKSCQAKRAYPTVEKAYQVIALMKRQKAYQGQQPYRCKFCNQYHIGRQKKYSPDKLKY